MTGRRRCKSQGLLDRQGGKGQIEIQSGSISLETHVELMPRCEIWYHAEARPKNSHISEKQTKGYGRKFDRDDPFIGYSSGQIQENRWRETELWGALLTFPDQSSVPTVTGSGKPLTSFVQTLDAFGRYPKSIMP